MTETYLRYSVRYDYNLAHVDLYTENGEFLERKSLNRWQIRDYIATLQSVQFSTGKEIYKDPYTNLLFISEAGGFRPSAGGNTWRGKLGRW